MERMTRSDVHDKVANIRKHYGADIDVDFYTPGTHSLGQVTVMSTGNALSSRLKISDLVEWLDGFCKALDLMGFSDLLTNAHTLSELTAGIAYNLRANPKFVIEGLNPAYVGAAAIVDDTYNRVKEAKAK